MWQPPDMLGRAEGSRGACATALSPWVASHMAALLRHVFVHGTSCADARPWTAPASSSMVLKGAVLHTLPRQMASWSSEAATIGAPAQHVAALSQTANAQQ